MDDSYQFDGFYPIIYDAKHIVITTAAGIDEIELDSFRKFRGTGPPGRLFSESKIKISQLKQRIFNFFFFLNRT